MLKRNVKLQPTNQPSNQALLLGSETTMPPSRTVRDLGIAIDSHVAMRSHVPRTASGCFAIGLLRQLRTIRGSLYNSVLFRSLVVSLLMPRLHYMYGSATHAELPLHQCQCLQSVLNAGARLIHSTPRYEYVTPSLRDLHWLTIVRFQ